MNPDINHTDLSKYHFKANKTGKTDVSVIGRYERPSTQQLSVYTPGPVDVIAHDRYHQIQDLLTQSGPQLQDQLLASIDLLTPSGTGPADIRTIASGPQLQVQDLLTSSDLLTSDPGPADIRTIDSGPGPADTIRSTASGPGPSDVI
ncbi:hypothetical protein JOB18_020226 [Solea senegalensis]|uniref:Uncharacterized protein n=1 Tax=Solea senegalensis TaxID=28829 RepID=A0AAV6R2U8_SOLSE|nr:hypothetical protein JOB18_020226 [Solea senegalensis]